MAHNFANEVLANNGSEQVISSSSFISARGPISQPYYPRNTVTSDLVNLTARDQMGERSGA
jgi:hypothetical protein